jgi:hypothetical protein
MTIDLTVEELERVLSSLKDTVRRRKADGLSASEEEDLIARLEVAEREQRTAGARPS